ncbi:hypothetical protein SASPL_121878 [Salvia splendens]|uniref:Uncharacterized protein n=1 Tax=Salvia splendens TaxID=180675 RepID=A0A8X8XY83_SALSN|nr:hypothetical protein SASPL_121878 [Salvia splendens]
MGLLTLAMSSAIIYGYSSDILLLDVFLETADTDAVARAAPNVLDEEVSELVPHGDAVVASLDNRVDDSIADASGDGEAIGVGTFSRGRDPEALESDVSAGDEVDVEVLAVFGGDVFNDGVVDEVEAEVGGELHAVLVLVTVVLGPGKLGIVVEGAAAREGKAADVVDGHPFSLLVGELVRVG